MSCDLIENTKEIYLEDLKVLNKIKDYLMSLNKFTCSVYIDNINAYFDKINNELKPDYDMNYQHLILKRNHELNVDELNYEEFIRQIERYLKQKEFRNHVLNFINSLG